MAEVYLAIQESLGRKVALKITSPWQSQDPAFKERFMQEGRIVATLNHPNIVTIHEIGQADEQYFIAMEYVAGKSLSEKIEAGMTFEESIQTIKRVARALAYAHNGGFLHRDIKPSNILFRDDEYAVLADFGIARALVEDDTRLTQTGMSPGSPAYMSPEQVNGLNLDARSDQYSLGIVFYEMLTGERPYKGNSATATAILHLTAPIPQLPHPYESLQPIFDRLLAKTPEERFTDEEALIEALDDPASVELQSLAKEDKHAATVLGRTQVRMVQSRVATPNIVQKPDGGDSSRLLRWGGITVVSAVLTAGTVFWLQAPSSDPDDSVAVLPADKAETATTLSDFIEEPADSPDTKASAGTPIAEPEIAPMPGLNGRQSNTPDIQESVSSEDVEAEVAQAPELNEEQPDSPDIQEPIDSQVVEAESEAAQAPELNEEQPDSSDIQEPVDSQVVETETGDSQEPDINKELLATAQDHMAAGRYMEPEGNNAFETYTSILANDAGNVAAQQGLTQIAKYYEQQARQKQGAGKLEQSLSFLGLALKVEPENSKFIALHNEVTIQLEKQQTQQQIEVLLQKAKVQLGSQRLARPKGDNAYESYQAILALDAGHQQAQKGVQYVAQQYEKFAKNKYQTGDLSTSLAMAERGLEVAPEHAGLLALRKKIAGLLNEQQASQSEVARLLAVAQQQFDADQLTQPKKSNARESYNAVLKIAPENQQARIGLKAISQRYEALVRDKQLAGETAAAFTLVKQGLQAFPKHAGLRALHDEIESQIEATKQAQRTPIEPQPIAKKPTKKRSGTRVFGTF